MSQSLWQIGRPDLHAFFLTFFPPEQQTCQIWVGHNFKIGNLIFWMNKIDTRHNTELKKSIVQSVSLCLSYLFLIYFDKQVHKKLKPKKNKTKQKQKKLSKQKNSNLGFTESTHTEKQMHTAALRHTIYLFF